VIGWLYRIVLGRFTQCQHKWVIHRQIEGRYTEGGGSTIVYVNRCEKCGAMEDHWVC
jgi:hypothetical protein